MSKKNNGASNALVQGSILAVASIISRIIGLIYRIPMQRILGCLLYTSPSPRDRG